MRLAVIGGNAWFIGTLTAMIEATSDFSLVMQSDDVNNFIQSFQNTDVEIVILECIGDSDAMLLLLGWARRKNINLRIIVKLQSLRPDLVRDAIQGGAWGCFSSDDGPDTLLSVLNSVAHGRVSFPFVDLSRLRNDPFEQLTAREIEVLKALANGWSNTQISSRLGISENTVKYHLKLIYDKLGVANRASAIAQYIQRQNA